MNGLVLVALIVIVIWPLSVAGIIWGLGHWGTIIVDRMISRYEDRVHRQSLAEARRLLDANREFPVRLDAGPPAKVRRARVGRKPKTRT